jgi:hypothetical protein
MEKDNQKAEQEKKEARRQNALKNLQANPISNLAIAYFAQDEKKRFGEFGETDQGAVEQFLYRPSLKGAGAYNLESGEQSDLVYGALLGSRQDGRRYSGQVSEYGIIQTGAQITEESLGAIKVADLMKLVGSKKKVPKELADAYIADIAQSGKEGQEFAGQLVGMYITYLTTKGVSNALDKRAGALKGGLEKLVAPEEKK